MRPAPSLALAALLTATAVVLSGCVLQEPDVVPPPEQTTEPVFASDEEALAAATDAYEAYLKMSDLIAQEGGKDPERLAPYVTEEWLGEEVSGYETLASSERRILGSNSFSSARLQQLYEDPVGHSHVVIYVCSDATAVKVLDSRGSDVTPNGLAVVWPAEVAFESSTKDPTKLIISGEEPWDRNTDC